MKTKLLLLLVLANFSIYAQQYTSIPDINFEKKLIALGIDSGTTDGRVLTSSINTVINLNVADSEISDLTGIENFSSLVALSCHLNKLTTLNLSKNVKLELLDCRGNNLTNLDFSKLLMLKSVFCSENSITSLDISKNPVLAGLSCAKNELVSLNVKNGNNVNFQRLFFDFRYNPYLSCIEVDNIEYSNLNWADEKDADANYSTFCGSPYTSILDPNFEEKLIALGIDIDGKNGKVLNSRINSITVLDVSNSSISNLSGIRSFRNLSTLNVANNKLTNLDLSDLKNLKIVNCSNNQLISFNLNRNTVITNFDLSNNRLRELNLNEFSSLQEVNVSSNLLTEFNPSLLESLKTLDVSNNKLETLNFYSGLPLTNLNCSNNLLTSLDISMFIGLEKLDASKNQLQTINFSNNKLLTSLKCSSNLLNSLDISKNKNLISLFCDNNKIASLDISEQLSIREISCENNNLSLLNLKNGSNNLFSFYSFKNNNYLDCIQVDDEDYSNTNWINNKDRTANYNRICDPYTLIPDLNFEKKLIALGIDSGNADGKVLTKNIHLILNLDVSKSNISDLTGIQKFNALQTLNCSSNTINVLDLSKNNALNNLNCNSNKLKNLDLTKHPNLIALNCSSNLLDTLDISASIQLKTLNCSANQLINLDVSKNPALTSLNCSKNNILLLDLRNGKNALLQQSEIMFTQNAPLACILVDDEDFSNQNWFSKKDLIASYGSICRSYILIPDANFEKKLIALGIDKDLPDGKILREKVDKVTVLNVASSEISDLSGIEHFSSLKELYCSQNSISTLDISKNTNLTAFSCSDNKLTTIDVSKNINLNLFACFGNKISDLDLKANTKLTEIYCSGNLLTTLDTSNNTLLSQFNCDKNQIVNLDLTKNVRLTYIYCHGNQLTSLNISENKFLSHLGCSDNKINNLDISQNKVLTYLSCSNNQISSLDTSKNARLVFLYCDSNAIKNLDITQNLELLNLFCPNNQLSNLDISKNLKMEHLDCSYNQLSELNFLSNSKLVSIVCGENKLSSLDVSKNLQLKSISCLNNQITKLDFSKNTVINAIICSNNELATLNLRNGNNSNFNMFACKFNNNPDLTCIQLDTDKNLSYLWNLAKDATATYSLNCGNIFELPSDNFTVETKSESCLGQNNGEISITAKEKFDYVVTVNTITTSFNNNTFRISALSPGIYPVTITVPGQSYEQNFIVIIQKGSTISGKSSLTARNVKIEIESGTAPYTVFLDGTEQFTTTDSAFNLDVEKEGIVEVTTAKACEGVFSKKITSSEIGSSLLSYPNPTSGIVTIEIPSSKTEVKIEIYNFVGQSISNKNYNIENRTATLNLENEPSGVYAAKIYSETPEYIKIIKK